MAYVPDIAATIAALKSSKCEMHIINKHKQESSVLKFAVFRTKIYLKTKMKPGETFQANKVKAVYIRKRKCGIQ